MIRKKYGMTAILLAASIAAGSMNVMAADIKENEIAFAECDEYVNIRSKASTDSDVVAKLYNHSAVTVLDVLDDGWCYVSSGNYTGYMKSDYLVAGEEAYAIENEVAYHVAVVYPNALNVRAKANAESDVIDVVKENQQLDVVNYDGGAWVKVAVASDSIGYVDASMVDYKTYYPVAVGLDEEKQYNTSKSNGSSTAASKETYETEDSYISENTSYEDANSYAENSETVQEYADTDYDLSESQQPAYEDWENISEEQNYAEDTVYTEESYVEQENYDTYEYENADYINNSEEDSNADDYYYDQDTDYTYEYSDENVYEEDSYTDEQYDYSEDYGTTETNETTNSSLGQSIADYAVQFVGNPYVYGGTSLTNGADCSGFTMSVMANFGIGIPRVAADQAYGGTSVDISNIMPGDLLFYSDGGGISHVALYIGGGQIVHASTESTGIIISSYNYSTPVAAARYW